MFVVFSCVFVTFLYGVQGQVWYFIISIPDRCLPSTLTTSLDMKRKKLVGQISYLSEIG